MAFPEKNYTLGRGRLYFDAFASDGSTLTGQRYIGNTPELNLTSESESLEHFDSDAGIKVKDKSVLLSLSRSGTFITDQISPENLAAFFLGESEIVDVAAATGQTYTINDVVLNRRYQVGQSDSVPAGVRNIGTVVVKVGVTTKTLNTDYTLDAETGGVFILGTGTIAAGADVIVEYVVAEHSYNRIITGASAEIKGAMLFVSTNPEGEKFDYYWPSVNLKPDGDFALKGDEFQQIGFSFEIVKKSDSVEAQYISGRPDSGI